MSRSAPKGPSSPLRCVARERSARAAAQPTCRSKTGAPSAGAISTSAPAAARSNARCAGSAALTAGIATRPSGEPGDDILEVALGHATTYTYDLADRLTQFAEPLATTTRYSYDPADNLARIVDPRATATSFGYDALGRMTTVTQVLERCPPQSAGRTVHESKESTWTDAASAV